MSARYYNISEPGKRYGSSESQSLLSPLDHNEPGIMSNMVSIYHGFCKTSKATILILLWTVFVGVIHRGIDVSLLLIIFTLTPLENIDLSLPIVIFYASYAVVYMFYPLNGYIADVCCGRFKTIMASLALLLLFLVSSLVPSMLYSTFYLVLSNSIVMFLVIICVFCLFLTNIGIAGYSSNFIQFGLDQLLDAPSHHQALFVHWAKWCYDLMPSSYLLVYVHLVCDTSEVFLTTSICLSAIFLGVSLILLLVFGCWKRHWFHFEPGHISPYATVFKVLNFARKHKYPRQRSAFTYCDNERPSRLDFGKERYGGPFKTEEVEDVKAFLRIVAILLAVGPICTLDPATSSVAMAFLNSHFGSGECTWSGIMVNSSLLRCVLSTVFLPVYMRVVFSVLRKRIPKIFHRLGIGMFVYFLGGLSIFVVDTVGHSLHHGSDTRCILMYNNSGEYDFTFLNMHWAVNIPSSLLLGIGPTIVTVTIFEFISAQSPHSMKGLLLGTYYAITGVYQFISSIALVLLTSHKLQSTWYYPAHTGCLFGYLLYICLVAFISFVLFTVAARKYRYRERDDRPYDHRFVIDVYSRYINQAHNYKS